MQSTFPKFLSLLNNIIIIIINYYYYLYRAFPIRPKALTIKFKNNYKYIVRKLIQLQTTKKMCFQGLSENTD